MMPRNNDAIYHAFDSTCSVLKISAIGISLFLFACMATPQFEKLSDPMTSMQSKPIKSDLLGEKPEVFVQTGHTHVVTTVAFSPDGRYALSGSIDTTIKLWDLSSGREVRTFLGHEATVLSVEFSHDGRYAVSGSRDETIRLWDLSTGVMVKKLNGNAYGGEAAVVFTPDGRYVLSGGGDQMLKLLDLSSGSVVRTFDSGAVLSVAISRNGRYALSGGWSGTIKIWDVSTGSLVRTLRGHTNRVDSIAISPDGRYVLSESRDNTVRLWEVSTGREVRALPGHADGVTSVAFSPDGRYALSGGPDKTIRLWEVSTGREIRILKEQAGWIPSVAISPDGRYALSGGNDYKSIRLWDLSTGNVLKTFTGKSGGSKSLLVSADGRSVMTSGQSVVRRWDISTGNLAEEIQGPSGGGLVLSPDHRYVVQPVGNNIKIWDMSNRKPERMLYGHSDYIDTLVFSPDGRYVASGARDNTIMLWDVSTGVLARVFKGHTDMISSLAISPDGQFMLSGSKDSSAKLWETSTGREVRTLNGQENEITSVTFSPDGQSAMLGGWNGTIVLWKLSSGKAIRMFQGHTAGVVAVAFNPDGSYALSGSYDHFVKLWEVSTGREVWTSQGQSSRVISVVFTPDGRQAISSSVDGMTKLWNIADGKEIITMIGYPDKEWIAITPEGYYNSSAKGHEYLNLRKGMNVYGIDQFYDVFYRPDIVSAKLRGEDINNLVTLTIFDAMADPAPTAEFTLLPEGYERSMVKVCYRVKSTGGGIGEVRLFHNGKLIQSDGYYREIVRSVTEKQRLLAMNSRSIYDNMRSVKVVGTAGAAPSASRLKGDVYEDCREIEPVPGMNEVSVTAFNSSNTIQGYMRSEKFDSKVKPEDSHLYILSIGIDKYKDNAVNLKYAVKDATDIEQQLLRQSATVYKPQHIHYELLADAQADKTGILGKIDELSKKIKPGDGFILFVAGHGVLIQNQYYMLTTDYNGAVNDANWISSNEIVEMSKKIKSLSQLFIFDTCHAGGVDAIVSGLYDARMSVLAKKMGLHIYASANSIQEAIDGYLGNGLFTYTLLDGLNNNKQADKNRDSNVSLVELGEYVKQTTTDLSKKQGHSQTPLIINFGKDNPVYQLR